MTDRKNIVGILAGGSGSRFGGNLPKQYIEYKGKMLIQHTLERFQAHAQIDEIIIAAAPEWHDTLKELKTKAQLTKISRIVNAGSERYHSSISVIDSLNNLDDNILIHDAARAFCSEALISRVIKALEQHQAISVGMPCSDTIMSVDENGFVAEIPNRASLRAVQTPQAFRLATIKKAYQLALEDPQRQLTDDCGAVVSYLPNQKIYVVEGEPKNLKVTFKTDLN